MANPIEAISGRLAVIEERTRNPQRDYIGSILSKTLGINAFRRGFNTATRVLEDDKSFPDYPGHKIIVPIIDSIFKMGFSVVTGIFQYAAPISVEPVARVHATEDPDEATSRMFFIAGPAEVIDGVSWYAILQLSAYDPIKAVALRLAWNVGIHVGLDLAGRAMDRIRPLKPPSATTLAV